MYKKFQYTYKFQVLKQLGAMLIVDVLIDVIFYVCFCSLEMFIPCNFWKKVYIVLYIILNVWEIEREEQTEITVTLITTARIYLFFCVITVSTIQWASFTL